MIDINKMIKDLLKDEKLNYRGNTITPIEDGSTEYKIKIGLNYTCAHTGDIVSYNGCKYMWFSNCWHDISEFGQLFEDDKVDERYINGIPVVKKMRYDSKEYPILVEQDNTLYMLQTFRPMGNSQTAFFYVEIGDAIKKFITNKKENNSNNNFWNENCGGCTYYDSKIKGCSNPDDSCFGRMYMRMLENRKSE